MQRCIDLKVTVVNHKAVRVQHREIPAISGNITDLLGNIQTGDLLSVRCYRDQPAYTAGLVALQQQNRKILTAQIVFP